MYFVDLFAGIGGLSLGLERAGMTVVAQVENDPWCLRILNKHWPDVPKFKDVRDVGKHNLPSAELVCGGFPCQPHSVAGNRLGEKDDRNLWPELVRVVDELQPTWVIGENVPGIATSALDNSITNVESAFCLRGSDSDYYRRILTRQEFLFLHNCCQELEEKGFEVTVFNLPACGFDAKHKRERIFIVGYSEHNGQLAKQKLRSNETASVERKEEPLTAEQSQRADRPDNGGSLQRSPSGSERDSLGEVLADSTSKLRYERDNSRKNGRNSPSKLGTGSSANILADSNDPRLQGGKKQKSNGENRTQSRNELSARRGSFDRKRNEQNEWESEPAVGRTLDGFSKWLDGVGLNQPHELYLAYANETKGRPREVLHTLRDFIETQAVQWNAGKHELIQETKILLTYLRELEKREINEAWVQLESKKAPRGEVRGVPSGDKPASSPHRSGHIEQQKAEHPNALQEMSRLLAQYSKKAWDSYCGENAAPILTNWPVGWDDGVPKVASGVPNRVDRLRGLGNAIVPQVVEFLAENILEVDKIINQ